MIRNIIFLVTRSTPNKSADSFGYFLPSHLPGDLVSVELHLPGPFLSFYPSLRARRLGGSPFVQLLRAFPRVPPFSSDFPRFSASRKKFSEGKMPTVFRHNNTVSNNVSGHIINVSRRTQRHIERVRHSFNTFGINATRTQKIVRKKIPKNNVAGHIISDGAHSLKCEIENAQSLNESPLRDAQ